MKRPQDVLEIFHKVRKEIPVKLALIGPNTFSGEDIIQLGELREIDPYIAGADLFLLPSSHESFGLAALEAMASGVAIISSNAGGLTEINIDGQTGYVDYFDNIEEMSRKAISILSDKKTLDNFKNNAFLKAQEYDINKIVPIYEKTYKRCSRKYFLI